MEIDFLMRKGKKVVPLEVKSGKSLSIKSLERIKATYGSRIGDGIVLHHGEVKEQDGILFLPYYAAAVL